MVKRRPGVSILPLMLIVILCVSWLTQLNQRDEMTYDEMATSRSAAGSMTIPSFTAISTIW